MSAMDFFWAVPPVTRTLAACTVVESLAIRLGILSLHHVYFSPLFLFKRVPEIWRLATPFLTSGPGIQILMDLYFLLTYGRQVEDSAQFSSVPGSFFIYVLFVSAVVLVLAGGLWGCIIFPSALWTAFVYNWSQTHIGTPVNIYFFTINGEYLPLVLTGITLLSGDTDKAFTEITAIFAAYLYERLTATQPTVGAAGNRTRPWIQTPRFVQRWFAGLAPRPTAPAAAQGVYQMNAPARTPARTPGRGGAAATGSSGGSFFGDSWRHRGPGRRLGGD